jgi:hypothetical protein
VEQESGDEQKVTEALVLRAAKTLQSSFTKQTGGENRKWRDVPPDEKKVWMRLARAAERVFREEPSPAPVPAISVASLPNAGAAKSGPAPVVPKPVAPTPPQPARDPIAVKPSPAAPAVAAKLASPQKTQATPQKSQGTSAMLRLLGLKPRHDA